MDNTRDGDLKRLKARFNDQFAPVWSRRDAYRSFNRVLKQQKDRKLTSLRHRLVRAQLAGDSVVADRISEGITAYSMQMGY